MGDPPPVGMGAIVGGLIGAAAVAALVAGWVGSGSPPPPPPPPPPSDQVSPAQQAAAQQAVHDARQRCLLPWREETGGGGALVLNAVLRDGRFERAELTPQGGFPPQVLECARGALEAAPWPAASGPPGRVRLQYRIDLGEPLRRGQGPQR